jgi:Flp pilus assembly protein TadD
MLPKSTVHLRLGLGLAILVATLAVYYPVGKFGFINYDDPDYVSKNPMVLPGVTPAGLSWAFTHSHAANWHPLTWISHMVDCTLFGPNAGAHHVVNLAFHVANSLLLFALLEYLTGATWRTAFVAGLFALHPLHIESVAWISERKDVLSTFFGLLSLSCYAKYARAAGADTRRTNGTEISDLDERQTAKARTLMWYGLALTFFASGLMSKPMLVSWPCLMLLLDWWPLARIPAESLRDSLHALRRLLIEKIPLFALSAASCIVTVIVQWAGGAMAPLTPFPLPERLANALVGYGRYLLKLICPTHLSVIYPIQHWATATVLLSTLVLVAITALVIWQRIRRPYLLVGWVWYLVTLLPVIGLVQVGSQSIADRYTYAPAIGLFLAAAWAVAEVTDGAQSVRIFASAVAGCLVAACGWASHNQLRYWQNSAVLFHHAAGVTTGNFIAYNQLGMYWADRHDLQKAEQWYQLSLASNPKFAESWNNLGCVRVEQGQFDQAVSYMQEALRLDPGLTAAHNSLGTALLKQGKTEEAIAQYQAALRLCPDNAEAHYNLGNALAETGKVEQAIAEYRQAVALNATAADVHNNLAFLLMKQGKVAEAVEQFRTGLRLDPELWQAHYGLGEMLATQGLNAEAAGEFLLLAEAYERQGRFTQAAASANRAGDLAKAAGIKELSQRAEAQRARYQAQQSPSP